MMNKTTTTTTETTLAYLQLSAPQPQPNFSGGHTAHYHQNPRKKRTKLIRIDNPIGSSSSTSSGSGCGVGKPKSGKKPDPSAPKITRPCSECGKTFWSWKALFGHMRCHPERQWRGINPPPNFRRPENDAETELTQEDHDVAACLLMLANGLSAFDQTRGVCVATSPNHNSLSEYDVVRDVDGAGPSSGFSFGFECSSCKKVFGSPQALGGHRASHKNVKGCFAITKSDGEELVYDHNARHLDDAGSGEGDVMILGHKCSICLRVFTSGQALGGHMRCHWDKGDEPSSVTLGLNPFGARESCGLDLNLPAPLGDDSSSSYCSSGLALGLTLGL